MIPISDIEKLIEQLEIQIKFNQASGHVGIAQAYRHSQRMVRELLPSEQIQK